MDILMVIALSLLLVPLVVLTSGVLRIALGMAFVFLFPGYTLIAALFPRRGDPAGIERLALSLGLSIAIVPLIGFALNYTPWGIRLYPMLISLLLFIVVMAAIAWHRRRGLLPEERFAPQLSPQLSSLSRSWARQGRWDRVLTVFLLLAIAGAIVTLAYMIATPKVGERFTEFYVLGLEGKAENYPREIVLGEEGKVLLGIVNRESETTVYKVEISIGGERVRQVGPIILDHLENWEQELSFIAARAGLRQKVEFRLYLGEKSEPYRTLHLWVNVVQE